MKITIDTDWLRERKYRDAEQEQNYQARLYKYGYNDAIDNIIDKLEENGLYVSGLNVAKELSMFNKIRAEIDQYLLQNEFGSEYRKDVSQIIDKYKAESEE